MHELSIAQALIETAEESIPAGARVLRLEVELGALSGVYEDQLRFCFDLATQGTALEGCLLQVHPVPARLFCRACQADFEPAESWRMVCPHCSAPSADLRAGRELLLRALEVEDAA